MKLLKIEDVMARTSLGRSALYALVDRGLFPAPVKLDGLRRVAWVESEVVQFIEARMAAREAANSCGGK